MTSAPRPRILLVDDSPEVRMIVVSSLDRFCEVHTASDLNEARYKLRNHGFDVILLDLGLPDGDGMDFYSEMHASIAHIPVIFLTADGEINRKLEAFRRGAEDYLVKPVDPRELLARIQIRLEKRSGLGPQRFGPLTIDLERYEASLRDEAGKDAKLDLTPHELKILVRLVQNREQILSRAQLIEQVWGAGFFIEARTVDRHLSALRKKLGPCAPMIRTVPGSGYMFTEKQLPKSS